MNKNDLRKIIKEEIDNVVNEDKIDYTDRNSGLLDAAAKLEVLKDAVKNLDAKSLADKKMLEYRYSRLGPMSADANDAMDTIFLFIKFLTQDNSRILNKDGSVR